ncbi:MAG: hypothetical protein H8E15_17820 [Planctomycetes bacterium]|nr:hypothetical protein [Planctomycetota bacterium]
MPDFDRMMGLKGYLTYVDWSLESTVPNEWLRGPLNYYLETGDYYLCGWSASGGGYIQWEIAPVDLSDPEVLARLPPEYEKTAKEYGLDSVRRRLQHLAFIAAGEVPPELLQVGESLAKEVVRTFVQDGVFPFATPNVVKEAGWFYQAPTEEEEGMLSPVENPLSSDSFFLSFDFGGPYIDT